MDQTPVMRENDGDRARDMSMSEGRRRGFRFLAGIQIALIVLVWGLMLLQAITSVNFGVGAAPALVVFVVFYLHFTKQAILLRDDGIRVRWIRAMRVWSPMLFFAACLLCLFMIS